MTSRGQVCYDAYRDQAGGKSLATGDPLPLWDQLSPEIGEAWEAAALAVEARFAEQFRDVAEAVWNIAKPMVQSAVEAMRSIGGKP